MSSKKQKDWVFGISAGIALMIAVWGIIQKNSFTVVANHLMAFLKETFSWAYLAAMLSFVLFAMVLAFSPLGRIRLGKDDEKPEYSTLSWFAMLFGAGMGVGMVFWGISEPLSHYVAPMKGIEMCTEEAARFSIRSSFMHWGLHPWACYAVMGLGLAFFQFRKGETALVSNLLKPLLGEKLAKGKIGTSIDIFTTVLTVIGVATSFGMGCLQICSGLNYLFHIPNTVWVWLLVIIVIGIIYLKTAISGVEKGIKVLSDVNLILFVLLMAAAFIIGPGKSMMSIMGNGIKDYAVNFFQDSLRMQSEGDASWIHDWRVFYWAWWLSWAPFVGVFIARISRGRTIREFVLGVMVVPTSVSIVWFSVFGGTALKVADHFSAEQLSEIVSKPETALFIILGEYRFGMILSLIAIVLLITFFITSANSATFVLAMLTSKGNLNPPDNRKVFWGVLIAVVAFALIVSGGISCIQTIAIVIAFPYLFVLLCICVSLLTGLKKEKK